MNDQHASTTARNRKLIEGIFAELAQNNTRPFADALADDVRWTTPGSSSSVWSRTFTGKQSVLNDLLATVRAQLVERVRLTVHRILADGDHVVMQASGHAMTKKGKPYNNEYCFLFRIADGKIAEVTEYIDTELASSVLEAPWAAAPTGA